MTGLLGLGIMACFGILLLIIFIMVLAFFLKLLIAFIPATLLAILVFLLTGGSLFWAAIVFLVVALIMSIFDKTYR